MITHNLAMRPPRIDLQMLAGQRVVVAVSGGADSTALALLLARAAGRPGAQVALVGLVHINHQLRGAESDADEAFCRAMAARFGVPVHVEVAPVRCAPGRSPEAAARKTRYAAFAQAAVALKASCVVTAHTLDDQVETVLLRLLRGAGLRGVSGIRATRGLIRRPLLTCRRSELRAWLTAEGEVWREDRSNTDESIPRNRVRHVLLPTLEAVARDVAPGGLEAIARFARLAADDEAALEGLAADVAGRVVVREGTEPVVLDRQGLIDLPVAVARRVIRAQVGRLDPAVAWSATQVDAVLELAGRPAGGGALTLPGVLVERVGDHVCLRPAAGSRLRPVGGFEYRLDVPGSVVVPEAGLVLSAQESAPGQVISSGDVALPVSSGPLTVRNRRPGDRVRTGSGHHRKLQDLMVDAKIPRLDRDRVPLVTASDGQILWVAGLALPGLSRGELASTGMVVLKIRKLETT